MLHLIYVQKILFGIQYDSIRNRGIHYAESPHFVVIFKDKKPYKDFDAPGVEGPRDLAYYLEGGLKIAVDKFQIETPEAFQVVKVKRGGLLRTSEGAHYSDRERTISLSRWDHARFNSVHQRGKNDKPLTPRAYEVAMHEAIGHGVLPDVLLSEEAQKLTFLGEGLATYFEYYGSGRDPHDYLRSSMIGLAKNKFQSRGSWINKSGKKLKRAIEKNGDMDFSIANCFNLLSNTEDVAKRRVHAGGARLVNYSDFPKGASFIHYMIEAYGADGFKRWTNGLTRDNFYDSLQEITGKSIPEIEQEWKGAVLEGFLDSGVVTQQLQGVSLQDQANRRADLKMIKEIYLAYSLQTAKSA